MTDVLIDVKADTISKAYWKNNRRFAAICNAVLFHESDVIDENNISQRDSEETTYFETQDAIIGKERRRDLIREIQLSETSILVGLENQQTKDKTMALRDLIYTAMNYINQMNNEEHDINAVFMIVLFYGDEKWENNDTLSELIKVPDELKEVFNDWKPIIIDVKDFDYTVIDDQEVRDCFEAIQKVYNWDGNGQLFESMTLNKETALFVSVVTGCKELEEYVKQCKEKEEINMCKSFDMVLERERAKERNKVKAEEQSNFARVLEEEKIKSKMNMITDLLKRKLGLISQELIIKINQANNEQLDELSMGIFEIKNENDIRKILS